MHNLILILALIVFVLTFVKDTPIKNGIEILLIMTLVATCIFTSNWVGAIIWAIALGFALLSFDNRYNK